MSTLLAFGASRSSPFRKMYPIQWSILASTLKIVEVSKILSYLLELTNVVLLERDEYYAVAITYTCVEIPLFLNGLLLLAPKGEESLLYLSWVNRLLSCLIKSQLA